MEGLVVTMTLTHLVKKLSYNLFHDHAFQHPLDHENIGVCFEITYAIWWPPDTISFLDLAYQDKNIVFRFIIEYSLRILTPR
jgi:hypothetical protein